MAADRRLTRVRSASAAGTRRPRSRRLRLGALPTLLFIAPAALLFGVFVVTPMVTAFSYAFFEWQGTARGSFSGFDNFVTLFVQNPYAHQIPRAFGHNLLIFAGSWVGQNTIGLLIAVLLHRLPRGRRLFQTLYAMPYLVSTIVVGYLWTLLLSPTFGPVNALLEGIGLDGLALSWLGDPTTALWVVVVVIVWQWMGFPVLLYGAALGGLPADVEEAASIDGANSWQRFWYITLPLLTPAITTVSVLAFIGAIEAFALPFAMGGFDGSPAGATDVLSLVFYRIAFESGSTNSTGVSSALATLMFLFIFVVSVAAIRIMRRREERLS